MLLAFFLIAALPLAVSGQTCEIVPITASGDSFVIETNSDSILVRVDKTEAEMSIEAACVEVLTAGYYRIFAGVVYSGETNESFFLQVRYPDSAFAGLCDPNAGEVKVINVVQDVPPHVEYSARREAGVFYFREGKNIIVLNHYALIANEYPGFINPGTGWFKGPESVHLYNLVLQFLHKNEFDLKSSYQVKQDTVSIGEPIPFDFNLVNLGPGTAGEIKLQLEFPSSIKFDLNSFNIIPFAITNENEQQFIDWAFDSLAVDDSIKVNISGAAYDTSLLGALPATIRSISRVNAVCDAIQNNNTDSTSFVVIAAPESSDLTIRQFAKTDSFIVQNADTLWFAKPGEVYSYFLKISNKSTAIAKNISVQDILPDSVKMIGMALGDTLQWRFPELAPASDTTLLFSVQVSAEMPEGISILKNAAAVSSENEDQNKLSDNVSIDSIFVFQPSKPVLYPDLKISQFIQTDSLEIQGTDTIRWVRPGDSISIALYVQNIGEGLADNVLVNEQLPEYTNATGADSSNKIEFKFAAMAAGADTTLFVNAKLQTAIPQNVNWLINIAEMYAANEPADRLANNSTVDTLFVFREQVTPKWPDVTITQFVKTDSFSVNHNDTLWFAKPGDVIDFTLHISNIGDTTALQVSVTDLLPEYTTFNQDKHDSVNWHLGQMPVNSDTTLIFSVVVDTDIPVNILSMVNQASVYAANEPAANLANNTTIDTVYTYRPVLIPQFADLSITQFVETDSFRVSDSDTLWFAKPGDVIDFTLHISNIGDTTALQVSVTDIPPEYTTFNHGKRDSVTWQLGQMPTNSDTTLKFSVALDTDMPVNILSVVNRASVSAANEPAANFANNTSLDTVFTYFPVLIPQLTDLSITQFVKTDSFLVSASDTLWFAKPGEKITYFIKIRNDENIAARNVTVYDIPPDSVAIANHLLADTLTWFIDSISALSDTILSFVATVSEFIKVEKFNLVNQAFVSADNEDAAKLGNNMSIQTETVFVVQPSPPVIPEPPLKEGCNWFVLDYNVYRPDTGEPLGITFELKENQNIRLDVYDMNGYLIGKIAENEFSRGQNRVEWNGAAPNGQRLGSGVYVIVLKSGGFNCWKKVIIAR